MVNAHDSFNFLMKFLNTYIYLRLDCFCKLFVRCLQKATTSNRFVFPRPGFMFHGLGEATVVAVFPTVEVPLPLLDRENSLPFLIIFLAGVLPFLGVRIDLSPFP